VRGVGTEPLKLACLQPGLSCSSLVECRLGRHLGLLLERFLCTADVDCGSGASRELRRVVVSFTMVEIYPQAYGRVESFSKRRVSSL
jgi:hypothetical protein